MSADIATRRTDLVEQAFSASRNRFWVANRILREQLVWLRVHGVHREPLQPAIVGWRVATLLRADLELDALEIAIWARWLAAETCPFIAQTGASSISPFAAAVGRGRAVTSVGLRGDSYDDAVAETAMALYGTAMIRQCRPWRTIEDVALATAKCSTRRTSGASRRRQQPPSAAQYAAVPAGESPVDADCPVGVEVIPDVRRR